MSYQDWPGFQDNQRIFVDYFRVYEILARFEEPLRNLKPEVVLGILRGGAVPAVMLSQRLGVPVGFLHYDRANPTPLLSAPFSVKDKTTLVVDDFSSTGRTLTANVEFVKSLGGKPITCTLYYDPKRSKFIPDVSLTADHFIVFPWERKDLSPGSKELIRAKDGKVAPQDQREFVGIDLDGVLVNDIRRKWYARYPLDTLLNLRDTYQKRSELPPWKPHQAAIITGRPQADFERTRKWMDENGLKELALHCRNADKYGATLSEMARYKAEQVRSLGITVYYESDLQQALLIAEACPFTEVIWWGKSKRLRLTASLVVGSLLSDPSDDS